MAIDIGAELALVQECAAKAGGKFREEHFRNPNATETRQRLVQIAFEYAKNYNGTFEWMQAKRGLAAAGVPLSAAEIAGILNSLMNAVIQDQRRALYEARRAAEAKSSPPGPEMKELPLAPNPNITHIQGNHVPDGTYTITFDGGEYVTLRVQKADEVGCAAIGMQSGAGVQFIGYLNGSDNNTNYQNIGDVCNGRLRIWKKYAHLTDKVQAIKALFTADPEARRAMGVAYAQQSGSCYVCRKKLTTPESIAAGIGPVCAGRV